MSRSGKLLVEARCRLVRLSTRVQKGIGNGDSQAGSQDSPTASRTCTRAPISSIIRHPQGLRLTGQGEISVGTERLWVVAEPNLPTQGLLGTAEDSAKD